MNEAVLYLVNQARVARRLEKLSSLPHGQRGKPATCPLARALNAVGVDSRIAVFRSQAAATKAARAWWGGLDKRDKDRIFASSSVRLPSTLGWFVVHFDMGAYPELIEMETTT